MILKAYAKLNLYLEVLRRRPDGYHDIKTVFERIDLYDTVTLKNRRDNRIKMTCSHPAVPSGADNLVFRGARLLQENFAPHRGVDIRIIKRIPVAAGLGGGSSDAAAVLTGLNCLWKLNLGRGRLAQLGREIGADVPFFIYNTPFGSGSGRGDKIRPLARLDKLRLWHILAVPRLTVSTPLIYAKWDVFSGLTPLDKGGKSNDNCCLTGLTKPRGNVKILLLALRKNNLPLISRSLFNSLEMVTAKLYPQVNQAKKRLFHCGLKSTLMSGSGPAVFGILSSRKEAQLLASRVKKSSAAWRVFVTRTI